MKKAHLLFLILILTQGISAKTYNEPDSAYLFSYATSKNQHHNGLHFAWSIDKENWHPIGPEHSYLRSDFGGWGSQKRMFSPLLTQDEHGMWHCFFRVSEELGVLAHATSPDLIKWRPQSYHYPENSQKQVEPQQLLPSAAGINGNDRVILNGNEQKGMIHQVPWSMINNLIATKKMADYHHRLYSENMSQDDVRFQGLKEIEASLTIRPEQAKPISDMLIGIFFEDINYAADGGIYAELIQNRGFEYSPHDRGGNDPSWNSLTSWNLNGSDARLTIDTISPVHINTRHYAVFEAESAATGLVNEGFDGIVLNAGDKYNFSLFARTPDARKGKLNIRLTGKNGEVYATATTRPLTSDWKKHELVLTSSATVADARLEIIPQNAGATHIDMVSLFPQKTFKNRKNGLRPDLAQVLADLHPRFVRFPGGCAAHGDGLNNMYRWKNTIGSLESRKPQRNLWGYHQTAGLGYYEYFLFCEDIGAEPLPVVPAGVPCQNSGDGGHGQQCGIPLEEMGEYIQEVLDLIEWANGDAKTTVWGRKRAELGHPKPFNLKYIGIGNEDLISDVFAERYMMICNAVREKYPDITVIGTAGPFYEGSDYEEGWRIATEAGLPMIDEHYYNPPGWYIHNQDFYDRYDRKKSKVYLGEYAAHVAGRHNNIETALAEALHLANVERNGDVVSLTSYAPLLAKEGHTQWNPDLIYFNNTEVKPTVGYYVQQLYGQHAGDEYLPGSLALSTQREDVQKRIASSVVKDSKTGDTIIKLVNMLPASVDMQIDLNPLDISTGRVTIIQLSGKPDDKTAKPISREMEYDREFQQKLPPYSFTVLRFK